MFKLMLSLSLCLIVGPLLAQSHKFCATKSGSQMTVGPTRSDTFNIVHTDIYLDFTNWSSKSLDGETELTVVARASGLNSIRFDLLQLTVDSVWIDDASASFTYVSPTLQVDFPAALNSGDTARVKVFYRGQPTIDGSQWGGFYYLNNIAYNLGVGFDADPHNYGRTWFPCFDQFVERSTYSISTLTNGGRVSQAVGLRTQETFLNGDTLFTQWELPQEIPSYLVGIAIGPYHRLTDQYTSIDGRVIPIEIAATTNDTADARVSFGHLKDAMLCFENWYGPYYWDRIGYVLTGQGAMEHPTNVAYPAQTVDGSFTYDFLMAHELAHHWWGDLTTCAEAGDMWINEGMAEFNSHLFFECLNGRDDYIEKVKDNWYSVITSSHNVDGGFIPIVGVGHSNTYGDHVYYKGAGVVHNLRAYLGDSLFSSSLKQILVDRTLDTLSTDGFETALNNITGMNMTPFFDDWLRNPGFAQFGIDSVNFQTNSGSTDVFVRLKQGLYNAPQLFTQVPVEIGFYDNQWQLHVEKVLFSGAEQSYNFQFPFAPEWIVMNPNGNLNSGSTYNEELFTQPISRGNQQSFMTLDVSAENDSSWIRRTHHFAGPGGNVQGNPLPRISANHYWTVSGSMSSSFRASAIIRYDGRPNSSGLDQDLVSVTEDSLILLYRPRPGVTWTEYPHYTKNVIGNPSNQFGMIEIDSLALGEYAFANGVAAISLDEPSEQSILLYPNPAMDKLYVSGFDLNQDYAVYNDLGQVMLQGTISEGAFIDIRGLSAGNYLLEMNAIRTKFTVVK